MKMFKQILSVCGIFIFFLQSCTLYPRYERPCMEMPEEWRTASDENSTVINARWWEEFQDPLLVELIQEALESNQDLSVATARIAQFRARLGVVRSQLFPQIFGQATFSRRRISQTLGNSFSLLDDSSYGADPYGSGQNLPNLPLPSLGKVSPFINDYRAVVNASYEVDLWGKLQSATDAAYAELIEQIHARRTVILSIVSSVAMTYIQLRKYERQLTISLQTLKSRQASFNLAQVRFEQGLTSELEVKQAASELDEAAIRVIQFQTLIPQQENLLSVLTGHPPAAIPRGQSVESWQLPPEVPAGLPAELLEQRPDILQAEDQLIAANFRIGEARALYLPGVTLTGYYGYESAQLHELFTNPSKTWQWMVDLLQPLFTGGRISSLVDLAQAEKEEAAYNYLQVILTALQEANDALVAHRNSKKALAVEYVRVRNVQEYLHLATLQYENGLVDYLNVLDAERRLFDSQLDLAQAQANVFLTLVDIYKALGGGWVVDAENLVKEAACAKS